jgi:hypothetical protein
MIVNDGGVVVPHTRGSVNRHIKLTLGRYDLA